MCLHPHPQGFPLPVISGLVESLHQSLRADNTHALGNGQGLVTGTPVLCLHPDKAVGGSLPKWDHSAAHNGMVLILLEHEDQQVMHQVLVNTREHHTASLTSSLAVLPCLLDSHWVKGQVGVLSQLLNHVLLLTWVHLIEVTPCKPSLLEPAPSQFIHTFVQLGVLFTPLDCDCHHPHQ